MTLDQYIDNINKRFKLGNATEHTFRGDLQQLLESLVPDIRATNAPPLSVEFRRALRIGK